MVYVALLGIGGTVIITVHVFDDIYVSEVAQKQIATKITTTTFQYNLYSTPKHKTITLSRHNCSKTQLIQLSPSFPLFLSLPVSTD